MLSVEGLSTIQLAKFSDPIWTARGERRASVPLRSLETLWFNTGTLCNIACINCYIESSPKNDSLNYLMLADVTRYLDEIAECALPVSLIGFTGGEPFMNPHFIAILTETLKRGFETLTLTNAMKPMAHRKADIARLAAAKGAKLRVRVSLDDWRVDIHDAERGAGSFAKSLEGIAWLHENKVCLEVAGRFLSGDDEQELRQGYAGLFAAHGIGIDCFDAQTLLLLPEMTPLADPPKITQACWGILDMSPDDVMCASARMVTKRRGAIGPTVLACTLLPYDARFELGRTLVEASRDVPLAHPIARHSAFSAAAHAAGRGIYDNRFCFFETGTELMKRISVVTWTVIAAFSAVFISQTSVCAQDGTETFKAYAALLSKYVVTGADGLNRVRYAQWRDAKADRDGLAAVISGMEAQKPSAMTTSKAFAYWANLYNAVTLKVILDGYPVKSIRDIKSTGTGFLDFKAYNGPWRTQLVTVEGRELSLDDIEHGIMRPTFKDPLVHYAVNCASIGCPNLPPKPFHAATLQADLESAARAFVNSPRGAAIAGGKLTVASIYHWFEEDFGDDQKGVIAHLIKYASPELAAKLKDRTDYDRHDYDWALNDAK